jgi:hypothetical protein
VDGIIEVSWGAWAVEVKTRPFQMDALTGLLEFCRRHPFSLSAARVGKRRA